MRELKRGSRGRDVVVLKKRLFAHKRWSRALGFTSGFGPITERQVKRFQHDKQLSVDGVAGPQTWAALNSSPVNGRGQRAKAVAWAQGRVGVTEHPAGSNWGHPVQDWIVEGGLDFPAPWCQFFCNQVAKAGNSKLNPRWFGGYTVSVVNMAARGEHGLKPTNLNRVQPGDWVYFDWGHGIAHVGMFLKHNPGDGTIQTIEGNTSFDSSGDQSNGGAVAHKVRSRSSVAACVAVPYKN